MTAMFAAANLFGTPIFTKERTLFPLIFQFPWFGFFILCGILTLTLAGYYTAVQTRTLITALKVGALSGLIGSAILFITAMGMTIIFHDAMMQDPGNIHEYELSSPAEPTQQQLSKFIYMDALGGALNMMWITPLAGLLLAGLAGVQGRSESMHPKRTQNPATP